MTKRRQLNFSSFDEAMAEAERVATNPARATGNYTVGQVLEHLARVLDVACGKAAIPPVAPPMRWLGRLARPIVVRRRMRPGFKLPKAAQAALWPSQPIEVAAGWAHLRESASRFRSGEPLPPHPLFGSMSRQQAEQLQCRHFELHLAFIQPDNREGEVSRGF